MSDFIYKWRTLIGGILILIILVGTTLLIFSPSKEKEELKIKGVDNEGGITIDIEGAVLKPGVYQLDKGLLIQDAINLAGGLTAEADLEKISKEINRADELKNHQKIYLPFKSQKTSQSSAENGKINLNYADANQLESLPGIGPAYAQKIIQYRETEGGFATIEEIMEISGIGEKTFEKIKDLITV